MHIETFKKLFPETYTKYRDNNIWEKAIEALPENLLEILQSQKHPIMRQVLHELPMCEAGSLEPDRTAAVILSGGMGTRLGGSIKALLVLENQKTLLETLLEKVAKCKQVFVMSSEYTHQALIDFLKKYGLHNVHVLKQNSLLAFTEELKPIEKDNLPYTVPSGNGEIFSLLNSKISSEVETITVCAIDNPKAEPLCYHPPTQEVPLVVKTLCDVEEQESIGRVIAQQNTLYVQEYLYLTEEERQNSYGYSGMFAFHRSNLKAIAQKALPWHRVIKKDGIHLETLLIDAFPYFSRFMCQGISRKEFFPIKSAQDRIAIQL